jgi:glycerol kinase
MTQRAVLAVDQGTTNSKAVFVAQDGAILASGSSPVDIWHPQPGWVEQDASQIWSSIIAAIKNCLADMPDVDIVALGISNQRESMLAWDRRTGVAVGPVLTWQCRRTADACDKLKAAGHEAEIIARTGLPLDPLFPATKARWLLDTHCQELSEDDICMGTVDSWLLWNFSGGKIHATDRANAARTQLFNIESGQWDEHLCELFGVSSKLMPEVHDSSFLFCTTEGVDGLRDGIPVASAIGDSHAALFGHGAFNSGDGKITFGTGSSVMTTVPKFVVPPKGITTTIAWSLNGTITYAFEGNILTSASILPWTAKLLGLADVEALLDLAQSVDETLGVNLVPAHVGLGSPHWNAEARGLICGLSFASGPAHVARAAAESIAFQVYDIFEIVEPNSGQGIGRLFVDGGPSRNPFLMSLVAGYLDHPVITCESTEASAKGAAYLAGLATGFWSGLDDVSRLDQHGAVLEPDMNGDVRAASLGQWREAIKRSTLST